MIAVARPAVLRAKEMFYAILNGNDRQGHDRFQLLLGLIKDLLDEMESQYRSAQRDAVTDAVTGLYNRRYFEMRLRDEVAGALRYGHVFSVALFDIDDFKEYNDRFGHRAGDQLLSRLGTIMRNEVRNPDVVVRFGGDEFAFILPHTPVEGALRVFERIGRRLASELGSTATLSGGVAQFPIHGQSAMELLEAADKALYKAKAAGKATVEVAAPAADLVEPEPVTEPEPALRAAPVRGASPPQTMPKVEEVAVGFSGGDGLPGAVWRASGLLRVLRAEPLTLARPAFPGQQAFRIETPKGAFRLIQGHQTWLLQGES